MTDTTCPSCDAPVPAGASRCGRCGYRFLEDGATRIRRPGRPSRRGVAAALASGALAAVAVTAVAVLGRGGDDGDEAAVVDAAQPVHLDVLSEHPLSTRAAERVLTQRYLSIPDDDETDVRCSGREPRPAHSVRRCHILYPGGTERTVVVITNANGSEVLSEP
jgi:ribosomal protein L40E